MLYILQGPWLELVAILRCAQHHCSPLFPHSSPDSIRPQRLHAPCLLSCSHHLSTTFYPNDHCLVRHITLFNASETASPSQRIRPGSSSSLQGTAASHLVALATKALCSRPNYCYQSSRLFPLCMTLYWPRLCYSYLLSSRPTSIWELYNSVHGYWCEFTLQKACSHVLPL